MPIIIKVIYINLICVTRRFRARVSDQTPSDPSLQWPQCHNSRFLAESILSTHINLGNRRDKYTIHSKAVVCQDVELKGDITIGSGSRSFHLIAPFAHNCNCRYYSPPQSYYLRHRGAYRNWDRVHNRRGRYYRQQVCLCAKLV